jgi:hypothetical protein
VITQEPSPGVTAVSSSGYESLQVLAERMSLRDAEEVAMMAERAGFRRARRRAARLPNGKTLVHSIFAKGHEAPAASHRRRPGP